MIASVGPTGSGKSNSLLEFLHRKMMLSTKSYYLQEVQVMKIYIIY
jgi:type II secretory ATPase GspE/PulE/Tfp pilus assembly ATPase PilB-like protein